MEITSGNIAASIIAGLVIIIAQKIYKAFSRKSIRNDITYWEFEKNHLEQIQRSSIQLSRSAFKSIFVLITLIAVSYIWPILFNLYTAQSFTDIQNIGSLIIWSAILGLSIKFLRRFIYLDNFNQSISKIDDRINKLTNKLNRN